MKTMNANTKLPLVKQTLKHLNGVRSGIKAGTSVIRHTSVKCAQ